MRKRKKAEQNPRFSFFGYETVKHILSIQHSGPAVRQRAYMLSHFSRVQLSVTLRTTAPHSSVHGILQARILGMGCHALLQGILLTQGSSLRLTSPALAGGFFTTSATGEAQSQAELGLTPTSATS